VERPAVEIIFRIDVVVGGTPQRLKPLNEHDSYGTAKAVPLTKRGYIITNKMI